MVFLRKSLLDTLVQIFILLWHLVAEISRFKFDDYRVSRTGASDLKLFGRCISPEAFFHMYKYMYVVTWSWSLYVIHKSPYPNDL